ncbi:DNA/RNA-binding protein KIN17-like [Ruditapes philippinarum]|uniref:DNA/RNA-binding protein KIN17-like n=1 Tax=Ruditapes philippinarum TaxID=129788 RepID=UPI00295A59EA|nr:DNA/RNA-binding protein KIN17-like [Ruditapes philippinarum]
MMSESHQRQLLLFAENPDEYVDTFSKDFRDGYVELLRRRFGTKRVQCNIVYQEYIAERDHTHMNSTQWETLTDFVKWLGKEGLCEVDYTEKGWFVKYIDRDPETIRKMEQNKVKERMDMDDNERMAKLIQEQVERGAKTEKNVKESEYTELKRESEDEKVVVSLGAAKKVDVPKPLAVENPFKMPSSKDKHSDKPGTSQKDKMPKSGGKRKSALDEIMEFEEQKKEKVNRKDYWLHEDIVVKVISKKLGDKYYKQKAYVKRVEDLYGAIIKMLDSGDKVKVDQSHLETVIPATGKTVMIVNGAYRGQTARLEKINEKKFSCTLTLSSGPLKGRQLENIPYEDICKIYQPS